MSTHHLILSANGHLLLRGDIDLPDHLELRLVENFDETTLVLQPDDEHRKTLASSLGETPVIKLNLVEQKPVAITRSVILDVAAALRREASLIGANSPGSIATVERLRELAGELDGGTD